MQKDDRIKQYTGQVTRAPLAKGSKSERTTVMLCTRYGNFELRRETGPAIGDPEMAALVGKRIRATGIPHKHAFIMIEWEELK